MAETTSGVRHDNTFPPDTSAGDPLHPASPRLRSLDTCASDPLHPASPRLRSLDTCASDPLHPASPRLRSLETSAAPCIEVPVRWHEPGVGEVRQGRFGQRPRCTGTRLR